MGKKIILLRHAKSAWDDPSVQDHDRPLASSGVDASIKVGKFLKEENLIPQLIICSTAKRARMTLLHAFEKVDGNIDVKYDQTLYFEDCEEIINNLYCIPDKVNTVMLVGHNPTMCFLLEKLTKKSFLEKFSTASVAVINFDLKSWKKIREKEGDLFLFKNPKKFL